MNMNDVLHSARAWLRYFQLTDHLELKEMPGLLEMVEQARREWQDAQSYYNAVSDTDLVDHAVYMMQAAEKKYNYLLKQARLQGVVYNPYPATGEQKGIEQ